MRTAALTAVLACVALVGATSAVASQFRAEQYEAPVSGNLVNGTEAKIPVMALASSTLKCKTSSLNGSLAAASSSLPAAVSYEKCILFGVTATVSSNSCQFVLNSTNESAPYTGTLGVTCSKGGDTIVIDAPSLPCKVTIPQQSAHAQVQYENVGFNRYRGISTTMAVTGLVHTATGVGCPSQKTFENGTVSGTYTLRSSVSEGSVPNGLYIANEQIAAGQAKLRAESYSVIYNGSTKVGSSLGVGIYMQAYLEGSASAAAEDLNMAVNFTEAGVSVVKTNGCRFVFHLTSDAAGTGGVACEKEGSKMVIEHKAFSPCVEEIPAQTGLTGVTFKNIGSGTERSIEMGIALTGIKFTSAGAACSRQGTFTDGKITALAPMTLKGYYSAGGFPGARQGIWTE